MVLVEISILVTVPIIYAGIMFYRHFNQRIKEEKNLEEGKKVLVQEIEEIPETPLPEKPEYLPHEDEFLSEMWGKLGNHLKKTKKGEPEEENKIDEEDYDAIADEMDEDE